GRAHVPPAAPPAPDPGALVFEPAPRQAPPRPAAGLPPWIARAWTGIAVVTACALSCAIGWVMIRGPGARSLSPTPSTPAVQSAPARRAPAHRAGPGCAPEPGPDAAGRAPSERDEGGRKPPRPPPAEAGAAKARAPETRTSKARAAEAGAAQAA